MTHYSHGNGVGLMAFLMTQGDYANSYWGT